MRVSKTNPNSFFITLAISALALLSIPLLSRAQTYVEPSGPPTQSTPSGRAAIQFLNASNQEQRKTGSLIIGERDGPGRLANCTSSISTGCSKLCLNADPTKGINDTNTCIADWSEVSNFVGGPFLRLLSSASAGNVDTGYVAIQASGSQQYSLIAEANPAAAGSTGFKAISTSTSNFAGQFSGRVIVDNPAHTAPLCLHGVCITRWNQAVGAASDAINLVTGQLNARQSGNIGVSGVITAAKNASTAIVIGTPAAGTPTAYTCGDGVCSTQNSETVVNCPVATGGDC